MCFGLRDAVSTGAEGEAAVQAFVRRVRDAGEVFVTPTVYRDEWGIRAAFSNWRTRDSDVVRTWGALQAAIGRASPRQNG